MPVFPGFFCFLEQQMFEPVESPRPFLLLLFITSFRVLLMSVTVTLMVDTRKEAVINNITKGRAQTAEGRPGTLPLTQTHQLRLPLACMPNSDP
jgi:hypothetical protein